MDQSVIKNSGSSMSFISLLDIPFSDFDENDKYIGSDLQVSASSIIEDDFNGKQPIEDKPIDISFNGNYKNAELQKWIDLFIALGKALKNEGNDNEFVREYLTNFNAGKPEGIIENYYKTYHKSVDKFDYEPKGVSEKDLNEIIDICINYVPLDAWDDLEDSETEKPDKPIDAQPELETEKPYKPESRVSKFLFNAGDNLVIDMKQPVTIENALRDINKEFKNPVNDKELYQIIDLVNPPNKKDKSKNNKIQPVILSTKYYFSERPLPLYYIQGLLRERSVVTTWGKSGDGKSYSMIYQLVCIAAGIPFCGRKTIQSPVLYIDREAGKENFAEQMQEILKGLGITWDIPFYSESNYPFKYDNPADINLSKALLRKYNAKVMGIDTLRTVLSGDENSSNDVQKLYDGLIDIRNDLGTTILISHHSNKSELDFRGSGVIEASSDMLIHITSELKAGRINYELEKVKRGEKYKFTLNSKWELDSEASKQLDPFGETSKKYIFTLSLPENTNDDDRTKIMKLKGCLLAVVEYLRDNPDFAHRFLVLPGCELLSGLRELL
jgi:hypothetical protein